MGEINLYQYAISPFTEKVRRVLTYKHLKWNPIDCHYEDKTNLLAITKGAWTRVPVLEWDGEVVYNSADIIKWLDRKDQARRVIPDDARGLIEIGERAGIRWSLVPPARDLGVDQRLHAGDGVGLDTDRGRQGGDCQSHRACARPDRSRRARGGTEAGHR